MLSDKLDHLANHDQLTGCFSRRKFFELSKDPSRYPATLILADLDHFKKVNDTFGHCGGDMALSHLTKVLGSVLRADDILARLGGEEFIVMLPNTTDDAGAGLAQAMRTTMRQAPIVIQEKTLTLTGSFGVASVSRCEDIDQAERDADYAMYAAKSNGRDQVRLFKDLADAQMPSTSAPMLRG